MTIHQTAALPEGPRRNYLQQQLQSVPSTVDAVLNSEHNVGLNSDSLGKILLSNLEYLFARFPVEVGAIAARRTHHADAINDNRPMVVHDEFLNKPTTHGQTRGTELLLTGLCERYSQQLMDNGVPHPILPLVVQRDCDAAFANLMHIYADSLKAAIALSCRNREMRQDVEQETWIAVFKSLFHDQHGRRFVGECTFFTFLVAVAGKRMNEHWRKYYKNQSLLLKLNLDFGLVDCEPQDCDIDYWKHKLKKWLEEGNRIPPGSLGFAFDQKDQIELMHVWHATMPYQKLVAFMRYFQMNWMKDPPCTFENREIAQVLQVTAARVSQLDRGCPQNHVWMEGAHNLLLPHVKTKLGI